MRDIEQANVQNMKKNELFLEKNYQQYQAQKNNFSLESKIHSDIDSIDRMHSKNDTKLFSNYEKSA